MPAFWDPAGEHWIRSEPSPGELLLEELELGMMGETGRPLKASIGSSAPYDNSFAYRWQSLLNVWPYCEREVILREDECRDSCTCTCQVAAVPDQASGRSGATPTFFLIDGSQNCSTLGAFDVEQMPGIVENDQVSKKRKRIVHKSDGKSNRRVRRDGTDDANFSNINSTGDQVLLLEKQIQESQRHYNNIAKLLSLVTSLVGDDKQRLAAVAALSRVFCRLLADARLTKSNGASQNNLVVVDWLKARYADLQNYLLECIRSIDTFNLTALTLCMELVKAEMSNPRTTAEQLWRTGLFSKMLATLLEYSTNEDVLHKFVQSYARQFEDVRHYTFVIIA